MTAPKTTLAAAARRTIRELHKSGRLENVDALAEASVLLTSQRLDSLADDVSPAQTASLVRAHLGAIKLLLGREGAVEDDAMSELINALATPLSYRTEERTEP
jgi:hypothetical protein